MQLNSLRVLSAARPLFSVVSNNFSSSSDRYASVVDCRGLSMVIGTFQEDFRWWTICGKLWRRRWSGGLSVAAILGPGGPSMATKISIDGPGGPILGGPSVA